MASGRSNPSGVAHPEDAECKHGLAPDWCASCKQGPAEVVDRPTAEATFRAKFEGDCTACNLPVYVGQTIHRLSNGRYVHEGCE